MIPSLIIAISSCVIAAVAIKLLIPASRSLGMIDTPGGRKKHAAAVSTAGGIAIAIAVIVTTTGHDISEPHTLIFAIGVLILAVVGWIDDAIGLGAKLRLSIQLAVVFMITNIDGLLVQDLGPLIGQQNLLLGYHLALPFTLIAATGLINSINMIDGADGLAGGITLISLSAITAAYALSNESSTTLTITLASIGAVITFLAFNYRHPWRHRAIIFMGNSGSLVLGFILSWTTISASQHDFVLAPICAALILALPIIDTISVMVRRLLSGRSPFSADRRHIHHLMIDSGMVPKKTVNLILLAHVLISFGALISYEFGVPDFILLAALPALAVAHSLLVMRLSSIVSSDITTSPADKANS